MILPKIELYPFEKRWILLVYLHIPYCDSKCHYCSFNSYVDQFDTRQAYMSALKEQLCFELKRFHTQPKQIQTLFIGGGTPSTIAPSLYAPIFELLRPYLAEDAEITTEANPNSATYAWLEGMFQLGVNRVSFGVQSFSEKKLKALNRAHSPKQAIQAIQNASKIGFKHLSLDLIYNYQGDTKALLEEDIQTAFSLPIDHLSAYELTIESNTPFAKTPEVKQESEDLAFFVHQAIEKRGFQAYEISNYGLYQSRHNLGYWHLTPYIGAGAGAVGFLDHTRFYPTTHIQHYIQNPLQIEEERLTPEDLQTERIFLGLRSCVGISKASLSQTIQERADFLCQEGKLLSQNNHYYNPNFFLADELSLYLLG